MDKRVILLPKVKVKKEVKRSPFPTRKSMMTKSGDVIAMITVEKRATNNPTPVANSPAIMNKFNRMS